GVQFVSWQPPAGTHLPDTAVVTLLGTRDGALWIGTKRGLAVWKNGVLTSNATLGDDYISALIEGRGGVVWIGTSAVLAGEARLCAVRQSGTECTASDAGFGRVIASLFEDRTGNLWVGAATGLRRWTGPAPKTFRMPVPLPELHAIVAGETDEDIIMAL